ncbi:TIR domain-containing protein [Paraburkholderia nodosa]|uniref:TIR domain-containing protein n=1 Tax=Paraburkholderia nodosa TaxID=392320 RepID=UPI001376AB38|nr:nucleotide-binding protein [Paraburkholderia nodosa]
MQQSDHYSLLVAPTAGFWDAGHALVQADRYIEHTVDVLQTKFYPLDDTVAARLKSFPAIFAYERGVDAPARVGNIIAIQHRRNAFFLRYEFDNAVTPIAPMQLASLADELDIDLKANEMGRTHWAVKQVDLFDVLCRYDLLIDSPSAAAPRTKPTAISESMRGLEAAVTRLGPAINGRIEREVEKRTEREVPARPAPDVPANASRRVFIVHGHNLTAKYEVQALLGRLGLEGVILDEQSGGGRTIIDKFEHEAARAAYAVVLLTPDDQGGFASASPEQLKPRARQNVILELGYFAAKLGRGHVCALREGEVEIPSDYSGVQYVDYDAHGAWKTKLAKEMRDAGLPVDMNHL